VRVGRAGNVGLPQHRLPDRRFAIAGFGEDLDRDLVVTRESGGLGFALQVYLGDLAADDVAVEIFAEPGDGEPAVRQAMLRQADIPGATNAHVYGCTVVTARAAENFTPRVMPRHREARVPTELNLIGWWPRA
jgi:starch phosphorylase